MRAEVEEDYIDGMAVFCISSSKECKIINNEEVGYVEASFRNGYKCPLKGINLRGDLFRQELHIENEEVGGHRVPLSNASGWVKRGGLPPINQNRNRRG